MRYFIHARPWRRCIALFLVLTLAATLCGCADMNDQQRTKAEGTGTGAAVGALIGAIIGATTGDKDAALAGAAIGAAIGGLGGYAVGAHVASKKAEYAREEDWLDDCIASASQVNQTLAEQNKALSREIDRLEEETIALLAEYRNSQAKRDQLAVNKEAVDKKVKAARQALALAQEELKAQEGVLAQAKQGGKDGHAARLAREIEELKRNIADLEGNTDALASMSARMSV